MYELCEVKITVPFESEYVPSFAMTMDVAVQFGAVSAGLRPQSFNDVASIVALPDAESFDNGYAYSTSPFGPATSSDRTVGGARVVNDTVLDALAPRLSAMEYVTVDVPLKPPTLVNVTTPVVVFTEYEPSFVTGNEVCVQLGAVSFAPHNRTDEAEIVPPRAAVSFEKGEMVIGTAVPPDFVSARAVGGTAH